MSSFHVPVFFSLTFFISQNASFVCKSRHGSCFTKTGRLDGFWWKGRQHDVHKTSEVERPFVGAYNSLLWPKNLTPFYLKFEKIMTSFNVSFEWFCRSSGRRTCASAPVVWLLCYFGRGSPLRSALWLQTQWGPLTELAALKPLGQYCPDAPL